MSLQREILMKRVQIIEINFEVLDLEAVVRQSYEIVAKCIA